jgi:hypothetical protein
VADETAHPIAVEKQKERRKGEWVPTIPFEGMHPMAYYLPIVLL